VVLAEAIHYNQTKLVDIFESQIVMMTSSRRSLELMADQGRFEIQVTMPIARSA
jgi:hypothetical protein